MQEVEFRTGIRLVPDHLASIMGELETWKLTYEEAVAQANRRLLSSHITKEGDKIVADHLKAVKPWQR